MAECPLVADMDRALGGTCVDLRLGCGLPRGVRAWDVSHNAALRQLGNRLVGILPGCLETHTTYD